MGKRYRYSPGSESARKRARSRAAAQGRAVKARGGRTGRNVPLDTTFVAPKGAARNAALAEKKRDEKPPSQRGMTEVGLNRLRQIRDGEPMSLRTLRRVIRYLSRHLVDKDGETWADWGKGRQAWNGWGGDEMGRWVIKILRRNDSDWFTKWAESPRNRRLMRHLGK